MDTPPNAGAQSRVPRGLALAAVTGTGLAVIWTAAVILTGWGLGYLAVPIGLVMGLVVADQVRRGGWRWGGVAAAMAAVVLMAGKLAVIAFAQPAVAENDIRSDPMYLQAAIIRSLQEQRAFSPEVQSALDAQAAGKPVPLPAGVRSVDELVAGEAQQRLAELTPAQHRTLARGLIDAAPPMSLSVSGVGVVLSQGDLLWVLVGVAMSAGAADLYGRRLARCDGPAAGAAA